MRNEAKVTLLEKFSGVCLEALKKSSNVPNNDNRSLVLDSKSMFPGEAMLTARPGISVKITQM
jgi:hypothetical protein